MVRVKLPADEGGGAPFARAEPEPVILRPADAAPVLEGGIKRAGLLRQGLAAKRAEIEKLRQAYLYGVDELEEELAAFVRHRGGEPAPGARKDPRVDLLLRSIQRRQSYAERLEKPLLWLKEAGEELLYLERRAAIDLAVIDVAPGVDLTAQLRLLTAAVARIQSQLDRIAIEPEEGGPAQPIEAIWTRFLEKSKNLAVADAGNHGITEAVCAGEIDQAAGLTQLSLKAARCLAESKGAALVISRLPEISPAAAGKLSEWQGGWLCLNGLKRLSPQTTEHLFRWPGRWLSLNGLEELSAEAAGHIARWPGRQLELMSLRAVAGVEHLAAWENAGGKLFVPDAVRRQIDHWRRSQRQAGAFQTKGG